jgi:hypothetical protein
MYLVSIACLTNKITTDITLILLNTVAGVWRYLLTSVSSLCSYNYWVIVFHPPIVSLHTDSLFIKTLSVIIFISQSMLNQLQRYNVDTGIVLPFSSTSFILTRVFIHFASSSNENIMIIQWF